MFAALILMMLNLLGKELSLSEIEERLSDSQLSKSEHLELLLQLSPYKKSLSADTLLNYAEEAIELSRAISDYTSEGKSLIWKAEIVYNDGNTIEGYEYLEKAKKLAIERDIDSLKGNVHFQRSLFKIAEFDFILAKSELYKALQFEEQIASSQLNRIYNNLANIFYYQSDYAESMNYYLKQRDLAEAENDWSELGYAFGGIGNIYNELLDLKPALENYEKALEAIKKVDKPMMEYSVENNIGTVYSKMGDNESAERIYNSVLRKAIEYDDKETIYYIYINLGMIESSGNEDYSKALTYYEKAKEYLKYVQFDNEIALYELNTGVAYYHLSEYDVAMEHLQKAYDISVEIPALDTLNRALEMIVKVKLALHEYDIISELLPEYFDLQTRIGAQISMHVSEIHSEYYQQKFAHQNKILSQREKIYAMEIEQQRKVNLYIMLILLMAIILLIYAAITNRALKKMKNSLEVKVKENLAKLRHQDSLLIMQNHQAAMGEMISMIAHQWKQPLNSIGIISQNLQDAYEFDELTEETMSDSVKNIMELVNFMAETINSFRNYYIISEEQHFSLKEVIEHSLQFSKPILTRYKISVKHEISEAILLNGAPNLLVQVFLSLIGNSRDAFIEKEITDCKITISAKTTQDSKIQIEFDDNAGGIPEEVISRVFDPYFTTKSAKNGTGIGLYICQSVIEEKFGGTIRIENISGGSRFVIELPSSEESS